MIKFLGMKGKWTKVHELALQMVPELERLMRTVGDKGACVGVLLGLLGFRIGGEDGLLGM